jgi:hypothetical protein
VPFLWVMGYQPDHNYELTPLAGGAPAQQPVYPEQAPQPMPPPPAPGSM